MREEHGTFERLVVGHVLGDLPDDDASRFRSHLLGCRDCRARVAELRGIAADLADAERDELERARVRTETPRRVEHTHAHVGLSGRITVGHVTVAALVVMVLAASMGFWNLHLRATSAAYFAIAEDRGQTLELLAGGAPLELELAAGLSGVATIADDQVAVSLSGVDDPGEGEWLVAWLLDEVDVSEQALLATAGQLANGTLAFTIDVAGASELVITHERDLDETPAGPELLRTRLSAPT